MRRLYIRKRPLQESTSNYESQTHFDLHLGLVLNKSAVNGTIQNDLISNNSFHTIITCFKINAPGAQILFVLGNLELQITGSRYLILSCKSPGNKTYTFTATQRMDLGEDIKLSIVIDSGVFILMSVFNACTTCFAFAL